MFRAAYAAMTDTHEFFMLLRRFGYSREAGLRAAGPEFARPLAPDAHRALFDVAARRAIPLMLFVSSDGMLQISSGPVPAPSLAGPWCNLIGERFNLHLDETAVARAWAVRKPTSGGIVTSLELYDAAGATVAQVFGERHEGERERGDWAAAIAELPGAP
jgi:putative hemin transport protein